MPVDTLIHSKPHVPFKSVVDPAADPHINGEYFKNNPTWHVEYSPWKAQNLLRLFEQKKLDPRNIGEVGCGAGEVLHQLQLKMDRDCEFWGYDVAPQAITMAEKNENDRLHFTLGDFGELETPHFDLLLALEVIDHVEDYLGFLRMLRPRAEWKIFSFSLDISVQSAFLAGSFSQRRDVHNHLHHFNKETAMGTLQYAGYDIIDSCYVQSLAFSRRARMVKPLRTLCYQFGQDFAVRLLGGCSLMILAH